MLQVEINRLIIDKTTKIDNCLLQNFLSYLRALKISL